MQEEGNIYTVLKNSSKKYVDNFEVIRGELFYFAQNDQEKKWAKEIGIKVSPYIIIDGELMSSNTNLDLMDKATGTIIIPQNVTKIGNGAFRDLTGLRSIIIPSTVKEIGDHAFSGNPTLENVVIEEGVEKIGAFAFQQCTALKTIKIADSVSEIGSTCFENCTALVEINFPKSLKTIPYRMLARCYSLIEIEVPEGIETIVGTAFEYCEYLRKITLPATLTSLDGSAFVGNNKLTNIEISPQNNNYSFSNGFLMSRDGKILIFIIGNLTEINVPNTVETIQGGVFEACPVQAVLNISENVRTISSMFSSNITRINVVEENQWFKSDNGNLYNKDMSTIYKYTQNQTSFTLPSSVKVIATRAFHGNGNLTNLTLSQNLEKIEPFAFTYTKITNLDIGPKVKEIHPGAFNLRNMNIAISSENPNFKTEDGVIILTKDGKKMVLVSQSLSTYNIPSSVEIVGQGVFYNKSNLKEIVIPESVKIIESAAFDYSTNLQKVEIKSGIESIGSDAFGRCNSLKEIIIDKKENSIAGAPWGCPYGLRAVKWK